MPAERVLVPAETYSSRDDMPSHDEMSSHDGMSSYYGMGSRIMVGQMIVCLCVCVEHDHHALTPAGSLATFPWDKPL